MSDLAEIRKRAMYDPQSLTQKEWDAIYKAAFSVPGKEFFDDDAAKVSSSGPQNKQKKQGWW